MDQVDVACESIAIVGKHRRTFKQLLDSSRSYRVVIASDDVCRDEALCLDINCGMDRADLR